MIFALALMLIAITGGALMTYLYDEGAPLASRLCAGACTGLAALGLVGFVLASLFGLTSPVLILSAAAVATPLILLSKPEHRMKVRADLEAAKHDARRAVLRPTGETIAIFVFYALITLLLWLVFDRAMIVRPDGMFTGVDNNFGDLPFHLSVITSFVYGENFPPEDPTYAGVRFTYPFLSDFVAAMFVRAGASLRDAMFLENMVLGVAFVGLLHRWTLELTVNRMAALVTPLLILLNGGFGWLIFLSDVRQSERGVLSVLAQLPHQYTISIPGYRWGNALSTLLIPQRGMLFGLPIAIVIFTQWWISLENSEKGKRQKVKGKKRKAVQPLSPSLFPFSFFLLPSAKRMIAAGVIAGLLPLVHAHSFIVVMVVGACLALLNLRERWREWAVFFILAMAVAGPQMLWAVYGSSVRGGTFYGWELGWDNGDQNAVLFWLKNTGLFIPLIIAAILWRGRKHLVSRQLLLFYLPFTLCFIVPNLIKLSPWVWDNIKVLFYWYVASAPLVALLLARLWQKGKTWRRALATVLFVSLTLSGALDVWRIVSRASKQDEFDRNGVAFAQTVRQQTPPRALVLHAPIHNHPAYLTGRRALMGYPGHIWSHGLEYLPREAEIKRIYAGAPDAESLLARHGIEYVIVSPLERAALPFVNDAFFERYTKIGESGEYRLYKIARP